MVANEIVYKPRWKVKLLSRDELYFRDTNFCNFYILRHLSTVFILHMYYTIKSLKIEWTISLSRWSYRCHKKWWSFVYILAKNVDLFVSNQSNQLLWNSKILFHEFKSSRIVDINTFNGINLENVTNSRNKKEFCSWYPWCLMANFFWNFCEIFWNWLWELQFFSFSPWFHITDKVVK